MVAQPLIRAIARTVVNGGRVVDLCGGSGHLTRTLMDLTPKPPLLADLYYAKLWLARRFTAPGCEAVCCDGNSPFPFARAAFRFAICADAFMFIWTKRQFVQEMLRVVGEGRNGEAAAITHTHNQLQWSPSLGQPLPPGGYLDLFETMPARLFSEVELFADVMRGGPLDLSRRDSQESIDADPALMIVASRDDRVFQPHLVDNGPAGQGEFRINPLYEVEDLGGHLKLRLSFPDEDYAAEFGACRQYLPDALTIDRASLTAMAAGELNPELEAFLRRRIILDLPRRYY
jgi:SAM-dependent methyltransferase